jgi:PAS domain S-box-containing protein
MVATDLTERKRTEARLRKLNRVYAVLSDMNQAIVRLREPQALFEQVCRIAVEIGGFRMAWIGLVDESSQMQVVAHAGGADTYFEQAGVTLRDELVDDCPIQNALRSGQRAICNMIRRAVPCQEIAFQLGSRSSAAFPLLVSGKIRGTVNLYSEDPDFFDEEEIKLLDELALDTSFAIEFAEKEAERKRAEQAIESLARFPSENPSPVLRIERDGTLLYANEASYALLRGWQLDVGQPAPSVLREVVSDTLTRQIGITVDTEHDQRIISFFVAPVVEAGYSNLYGRDVTDRRRVEEALRESESKFKAVFENAPIGISLLDTERNLFEANLTLERITRITKDGLLVGAYRGRKYLRPDGTEMPPSEFASARAINENQPVRDVETGIVIEDGQVIWTQVSAAPLGLPAGRVVVITQDMTERKRAEEKLQNSEAFLNRMIEQSPSAMWIADNQGNLIRLNQACCDLLNITADEVVGRYNIFQDNIVKEQGFLPQVKAVFERGETARFEIRYDSSQVEGLKLQRTVAVFLDVTIFPIKDANGRITNAVIQHNNITERKQAEEALRESENTVRAWLNAIQESAFLIDREGIILATNATVAQRMHRSVEELIGACIYDFIPPQTAHARRLHVAQVIESGQPVRFEDERSGRIIDNLIYPVFDQTGQVKHLAILGADITERKRAEAQLAEQLDELRRWHDVTLGRENRILDLKHEVNELLAQAGQPPRYASAESENQEEK